MHEKYFTIAGIQSRTRKTDMSYALYRRIGFQEYCKLLHYEWRAET